MVLCLFSFFFFFARVLQIFERFEEFFMNEQAFEFLL